MFARKEKLADFRDDYATCADFCHVFQTCEKQLYLLAFLLTADDDEAEACLLATIEASCKEKHVFRGWEKSWSKHCVIRKAIGAIASRPLSRDQQPEICRPESRELELGNLLGAVLRLEPWERIVFVATVLDHYSIHECALLLGRAPESVDRLKLQAIGHLSEFAAEHNSGAGLPLAETARTWGMAAPRRRSWRGRYLDSPCLESIWRGNRSPRSA